MSKLVNSVLDTVLGSRRTTEFQVYYGELQASTRSGWPSVTEAKREYIDALRRPVRPFGLYPKYPVERGAIR